MIQKIFIDNEDTDDTNANLENLIKIHKKNGTDYALEYIVSITILIALFMQESISRNRLFIIALLGIIYEIISLIYMYFRYYKKETITEFSIKKVIDEC